MKTSQITALFHGTQTAQELDLSTLQGPMETANARSATDVSRIAPAQNPVQLYEEELKVTFSPGSRHLRLSLALLNPRPRWPDPHPCCPFVVMCRVPSLPQRGGKTEKSNLGRLKWPQLSQKEKMPFVNRSVLARRIAHLRRTLGVVLAPR